MSVEEERKREEKRKSVFTMVSTYNTDYVLCPNPAEEHPTQCYPNLPLWRYPSKYKVRYYGVCLRLTSILLLSLIGQQCAQC